MIETNLDKLKSTNYRHFRYAMKQLFVSSKTKKDVLKDRRTKTFHAPAMVVQDEICEKCKTKLIRETRPIAGRAAGSPGLHICRFICDCGCSSVDFFTVVSRAAIAPRSTVSLQCLPYTVEEQNHYDSIYGVSHGF